MSLLNTLLGKYIQIIGFKVISSNLSLCGKQSEWIHKLIPFILLSILGLATVLFKFVGSEVKAREKIYSEMYSYFIFQPVPFL